MSCLSLRRGLATAVTAVAVVGFTAGPASAHFCFKDHLNAQAAAGMSGSQGWISVGDAVSGFLPDLCADGVAFLATSLGATTDTLIKTQGVMAGGNLKNGKDNPAINHLVFPETDAEFEALVGAAYEQC